MEKVNKKNLKKQTWSPFPILLPNRLLTELVGNAQGFGMY